MTKVIGHWCKCKSRSLPSIEIGLRLTKIPSNGNGTHIQTNKYKEIEYLRGPIQIPTRPRQRSLSS